MKRFYGWNRQLPDFRDLKFAMPMAPVVPAAVDLRLQCPQVYDQGQLGSCTANAVGAAHQFEQMKQNQIGFVPSRLFIYYNERKMEGSIEWDSGAYLRDGMKSIAKQGVCPETEWPYLVSKFADRPSCACYKHALEHQGLKYMSLNNDGMILKVCLSSGYPFVFGFSVYDSFESAEVSSTGNMPMPKKGERVLGGHAVMCVGYNDLKQHFIVRNSWGEKWGDRGYFYMPYRFMTDHDLCSDFWTLRLVE